MNNERDRIAVLDFGGQYAHLIASRLRRLGVYSEIVAPEELSPTRASQSFRGLIYSGGPSSVYESDAPSCSPELLEAGLPVLGICYGHQLLMKQTGAKVTPSNNREYGPARLNLGEFAGIFQDEETHAESQVWMSHGDEVDTLPEGFRPMGATVDCKYAAVGNLEKRLFGIQFHPEVADTPRGEAYLRNFIRICELENSWSLKEYLHKEIELIREQVGDKKVFFLISGGVDSSVAYSLLARALPADHLTGLLVDTGFMREGEIENVRRALLEQGVKLQVKDASAMYYEKLKGIADPETKRNIIGELFVDVQAQVSEELGLNSDEWYLGQGTIYPDTIESGATKNSHKIKTHHNRVERIEELLRQGKVVEPIRELYKNEVRELGRLLDLPEALVGRHPFPGPGLAVRCLCLDENAPADHPELQRELENSTGEIGDFCKRHALQGFVLPLRSVGVQGDQRTYRNPALFLPESDGAMPGFEELRELSRLTPNRIQGINRVLWFVAGRYNLEDLVAPDAGFEPRTEAYLTPERIAVLRKADHIVSEFLREKDIYDDIWQFPVVLVPVRRRLFGEKNTGESALADPRESIILRPVNSLDAMTAGVYAMSPEHLRELGEKLLGIERVDGVFYDLTSKPPGTIEWE